MKRFFLLPLCIAALSACSDDETAEQKPAVIGDVQFAAAIDPAEAGTRRRRARSRHQLGNRRPHRHHGDDRRHAPRREHSLYALRRHDVQHADARRRSYPLERVYHRAAYLLRLLSLRPDQRRGPPEPCRRAFLGPGRTARRRRREHHPAVPDRRGFNLGRTAAARGAALPELRPGAGAALRTSRGDLDRDHRSRSRRRFRADGLDGRRRHDRQPRQRDPHRTVRPPDRRLRRRRPAAGQGAFGAHPAGTLHHRNGRSFAQGRDHRRAGFQRNPLRRGAFHLLRHRRQGGFRRGQIHPAHDGDGGYLRRDPRSLFRG